MHDANDVTPRFRNYFRPEEYFNYNIRAGVIRSPAGTRMLTIPEELLLGIHQALEDEAGSAAPVVLYQCGRWWGRRLAQRMGTEVRQFYRIDPGDMLVGGYLQVLRRMWALCGWGRLDLDFGLQDHGFIEIRVDHSIFSEVVGNIGRPSEALVAGVLASLVSEMAGRDLECAQTACKSAGDARAVFLVGMKSRVEVINAWVKQAKPHAQIRSDIESGNLI